MCFAPQRRVLFQHLNVQKWSEPGVLLTFWLRNVLPPQQRALFRHLNFQKWYILTSKCASRHNRVTCSTSQLPKWSKHGVLCTFWLRNVLRATTACTFSTSQRSQRSKVVRTWCALYILTSKYASRHTPVCNFSSLIWPAGSAPAALASLLFDHKSLEKTQCVATFVPFRAPASSFFWLFLFSDLLSAAFLFSILLLHLCFSLSILSEVWLLNFLRLSTI